ncbi:UvrD-helicase domain-containing protein [Desulfonatronovibrio magnus]|uniref:UvrD-helicase domain-containing protein n=1 Tax=Desulfonatronovibrio magnus TaxID=698827 RepID=UPI0005EB001D|nr:UvrD-helicase domain-containing protein [Desulfonatronovibrio magnus]RQD65480.1 MAG: DNA helicase UvrD [Desulfonatronovibrio sp. MSAO_Bac4]
MDIFLADLHIHSRFSRATSKSLDPLNLAAWAQLKGISIVGTGDFTHPGWMELLEQHLSQGEDGLLHLKDDKDLSSIVPGFGSEIKPRTRFLLSAEISSIYKKGGKVRKIHNLVFMPGLSQAKKFNEKLDRIGNLKSDGRPILGLDSRNLLEMVLETDSLAYVIPAHIWTPWFSLFGSKSGFDTLEECFGDLSSHIFALETGLSSDPEMNWMWSKLDRYSLVSNSDAHSAENLGREVNMFQGDMSYEGIYRALRREGLGHRFLGTLEFYPEEGKYHLDGHRKCNVVFDPAQTIANKGKCPVCGKNITVGVLNRVLSLADRDTSQKPEFQPDFFSVIPLKEIISEFLSVGPKSKKVHNYYTEVIGSFGSEINVLQNVPVEDLKKHSPVLAAAIQRMRAGEVFKDPGFDGQFGRISVFSPKERLEFKKGKGLMYVPVEMNSENYKRVTPGEMSGRPEQQAMPDSIKLNSSQQEAVKYDQGPVLVMAGPGTGKTQTLMGKVSELLNQEVNPRHILIVTFTRRAAGEIQERLARIHGNDQALPRAETIHAMAFEYWQSIHGEEPLILGEEEALRVFSMANEDLKGAALKDEWKNFNLSRENQEPISENGLRYARQKHDWNLVDYNDLLEFWLEEIHSGSFVRPFTHILVDEVQDLSRLQLSLVASLLPEAGTGFFGIGDPRQSIYGFRGALENITSSMSKLWPDLKLFQLAENYRSSQVILDFAQSLFPDDLPLKAQQNIPGKIFFFQAAKASQEGFWVGEKIKALLGGTAHWESDNTRDEVFYSPSDIAVLVRFKGLIPPIEKELQRRGIPVSVPESMPYFKDPRIELILKAVSRVLGVAGEKKVFDCPEKVLAGGPNVLAAYLEDVPPFDRIFWKGKAFKTLESEYQRLGGWTGVINDITLESELGRIEAQAQKVMVMTMHAAKGLEFEAVFLPCLEDGIMPFAGADFLLGQIGEDERKMDPEQEKRLLYVALTRARQKLYLSLSNSRKIYGKKVNLKRSRFLSMLPLDRVRVTRGKIRKTIREKKPAW